jgi:hypothetical protein
MSHRCQRSDDGEWVVIAPFVYYVHEKAWDYYGGNKARTSPTLLFFAFPTVCSSSATSFIGSGHARSRTSPT